jgi:cytidine deaminase
MHFWQLKRFWKEQRLCETDVEYHSFSEIATIPAVPVGSRYSTEARMVVEEMIKYREEFHSIRCLGSDDQDLGTFWMRKTKKPVLSVLLVRRANGSLQLVRGTNMEVSMPTGSLCAERNAIGSALGQGLRLRRKDIIGVAVLGTSLKEDTVMTPMESRPITPSESPVPGSPARSRDNSMFDLPSPDPWTELGPPSSPLPPRQESRSNSVSSQQSGEDATGGANRDRSTSVGSQDGISLPGNIETDLGPTKQSNLTPSPSRVVYRSMRSMHTQGRTASSKKTVIATGDNSSPQAAVNLLGHQGTGRKSELSRGRVVKTIVVNPGDRNPLRPCGACSEWLKKIAEVNPKFFVITFTDEACSGIYIEEIDSSE